MKNLLVFLVMLPSLVYSQSAKDSLTFELSKFANEKAIVGYSVAIINSEGIIYSHAFGYADRENKVPYTTKTVQPIASISKTLIGVSLMKAQEMGLLNLEDDINRYLPYKIVNPRFPDAEIKIKHLANHSSGLRDTKYYEKSYIFSETIPKIYKSLPFGFTRFAIKKMIVGYNKNTKIPLSEFIRNIYVPGRSWYSRNSFAKWAPGEEYSYCNNGAAIASMIIEKVSGMSYTEFVKTYIMQPLSMEYSGWDMQDFTPAEKSKLYPFLNAIPDYKLITLADGGFVTNVLDFSKYLSAVIRGYNGEDNLITAKSYDRMLKKDISHGQGIFWAIDEFDNKDHIGHTGGDPGVQTKAIIDTKNNLGYILFSNTNTPAYDELDMALEKMIYFSKKIIVSK